MCTIYLLNKGDDLQECGWASPDQLKALRQKMESSQKGENLDSRLQWHQLLSEFPVCQCALQILDSRVQAESPTWRPPAPPPPLCHSSLQFNWPFAWIYCTDHPICYYRALSSFYFCGYQFLFLILRLVLCGLSFDGETCALSHLIPLRQTVGV